jgi:histidine ammonia-lyase
MPTHKISSTHIDFSTIRNILGGEYQLALSEDAIQRINKCRDYIDHRMQSQQEPIYGINTGFGALIRQNHFACRSGDACRKIW